MKFLTVFLGNPILEILTKNYDCVGSTKMRGCFLVEVCPITIYNCPVILRCFLHRFIWFWVNLRNLNPRKITFLVSFSYESIFALSCPTTGHSLSDVVFHGESYDAYHVTVAHCTKKFCTKNLEKVAKIHENSSNFKKIQHFSGHLDVFFHMNRSKTRYVLTEKTSKNPRNSA